MTLPSTLDAGPWRLRQGRIVGIETGGSVIVEQAGDRLRLVKPGVGAMTSADASTVRAERLPDGALRLCSTPDDLDIVLEPAPRGGEVEATAAVAPTLVRTYSGTTPEDASRLLEEDGRRLAGSGYRIAGQSWAGPERSIMTGVAGLLLLFAGLFFWFSSVAVWLFVLAAGAILLIAYGATQKPGMLTVTYELLSAASTSDAEGPRNGRSVRERLVDLDALHSEHLVSDDEYRARRRAILEDV